MLTIHVGENQATAMHIGVSCGHKSVVDLWGRNNPELLRVRDKLGLTPVHVAAMKGQDEILALIAEIDTSLLDTVAAFGSTTLQFAAQSDHLTTCLQIIKTNPDQLLKTSGEGFFAYQMVPKTGESETAEVLKSMTRQKLSERPSEERTTASPARTSFFSSQRPNSDSPNSGNFSVGDIVTIAGLTARPELNGRQGVIDKYMIESQRYGVKVEGEPKALALKSINLVPCPADAQEVASVPGASRC